MNYTLVNDTIGLVEKFEIAMQRENKYPNDINGFKHWIADNLNEKLSANEPDWEGKKSGRSSESVISTMIVHLNRYAKTYSRSAIHNSDFSTQEEFIYLINLKAFGAMTKMKLIKKNIQEKPVGMQIINRLIRQGWVEQRNSEVDKRSKVVTITDAGLQVLELQMDKIRKATRIVTGDLTHSEKMELIRLLTKLNNFHQNIFSENMDSAVLLDTVTKEYIPAEN